MSIICCSVCGSYIDTDFDIDCFINGEAICQSCREKMEIEDE